MAAKDIQISSFTEDESTSLISQQTEKNNYELAKTKLIYLCYYGASGSLIIYLPVYYRQLNMNDLEAGILASLLPFGRFIGAPLWGAISDRTGRHKSVLLTAYALYILLVMMIYPFSHIDELSAQFNTTSNISLKWNETVNRDCVTFMDCVTANHSSSSSNSSFSSNEAIFWLLFLLTGVAFLFMSTVGPIMDATVVTMDTGVDYGNPRLWGAFGFGFFGFLSGLAANDGKIEVNEKADFLMSFVMFLILNTLSFIVCLTLKSVEGRQPSDLVLPHIKLLVTKPRFLVFITVVLIMGIASGVITWLMFIFLKDLGGSQTLLGMSIAVSCSSEVVVFSLSGRIVRRLGSDKIFFISLAMFIVRLVAYSYLENPWLVLSIEPLHGFTFAAMWAACVSYSISVSPKTVATTVIGLITSVYFGLGWGLGGTFGGIVYQYYGSRVLFRSCAVMCGIGMVLHTIAVLALRQFSDDADQD